MAQQSPQVVLVVSVPPGDRLHSTITAALTADLPAAALVRFQVGGSPTTASQLVRTVSQAAFVVVQEPASQLSPEHIAAAAAARARAVPLLLISPFGAALPQLMRIADIEPSRVVFYPNRQEDAAAWDAFAADLAERAREIGLAYDHARRTQYLDAITNQWNSAAGTLDRAAPSEEVALAIARVFEAQTRSIVLDDHIDFLELTFPASLYTQLLNQLTTTFKSVRTIADPVAEQLPWENPVERESLATVTERIFVIDGSYARQFGVEPLVAQLKLALQPASGGVSVVGLTEPLRAELDQISSSEHRLKGLNRFYAGDDIVGGYADETGARVRLLAYHEAGRGAYEREALVLAKLESLRKGVPADRSRDLTALASWVYSNVLPEPDLNSIYEYGSPQYAEDYDGNIVRVTPQYYAQLDTLAAEVRRALVALYAPYSRRDRSSLRLLELGFGTGALTGRIQRVSARLFGEMRNDADQRGRSFVEIEGWDANQRMVEIATRRLSDGARRPHDPLPRPYLEHRRWEPGEAKRDGDEHELVVASFFSHYWTDARPDQHHTRPESLHQFRGFLEAVRNQLLAPGGLALFLDAFYTSQRHDEERAWRKYVEKELGSRELADSYLSRNPWQFRAPARETVQQVAEKVGFTVWWRDAVPGLPFKVLILAAP